MLGDLKSHSQLINNILILLAKRFIFNLQSVETMRIERFRTFVKHHSTVEKYLAKINSIFLSGKRFSPCARLLYYPETEH
jgi:hypothetical protein